MNKKYFDNVVVNSEATEEVDNSLLDVVLGAKEKVRKCMDELKVADAIDEVFEIFKRCNKYIDETTPWILAKEENKDRLKKVIYNLLDALPKKRETTPQSTGLSCCMAMLLPRQNRQIMAAIWHTTMKILRISTATCQL